jgi:predicted nucleic acid-binding protein
VGDANAVIGLAKGGVFDHLSRLFARFLVPPRVTEEVVVKGHGKPGAAELAGALGAWVTEVAPDPSVLPASAAGLSTADRDVLAVAVAERADYVLTDDRDLRREASRLSMDCLGTAEVVVLMKDRGLVTSVRTVLDQMQTAHHGITPNVYERALRTAGEWPAP